GMHTVLLYDIFSRKSTIKLAKHFEEAGEKRGIILTSRKTIYYNVYEGDGVFRMGADLADFGVF
ncbi:MAG: hypothetical protein IKX46_00065, partial [Verrucomicrobia bacterium]|nr:hypothetical protein [Verrucomicrobiota bacterium]